MVLAWYLTSILKKECRKQYLTKFTANNTTWQKMHQSAKAPFGDNLDKVPPPLLHSPFWMAHTISPPILMKLPMSCLWRLHRFALSSFPTQSLGLFQGNVGNSVGRRQRRTHPHLSLVCTLTTILQAQTAITSPNSTCCESHWHLKKASRWSVGQTVSRSCKEKCLECV
jgi:hypothetical protein